jgi:hypothetical protein
VSVRIIGFALSILAALAAFLVMLIAMPMCM